MAGDRCPHCQALNPEQAARCSLCGRPLGAESARPAGAPDAVVGPVWPTVVTAKRALGVGVLAGALLLGVTGLVARLLWLILSDLVAVALPPLSVAAPPLSPIRQGVVGLPPFLHTIATGALVGALVGWLAAFSDRLWVGAVVPAALFIVRRSLTFVAYRSWYWFGIWYGETAGPLYGWIAVAAAGGWGVLYGLFISRIVLAYLETVRARPVR